METRKTPAVEFHAELVSVLKKVIPISLHDNIHKAISFERKHVVGTDASFLSRLHCGNIPRFLVGHVIKLPESVLETKNLVNIILNITPEQIAKLSPAHQSKFEILLERARYNRAKRMGTEVKPLVKKPVEDMKCEMIMVTQPRNKQLDPIAHSWNVTIGTRFYSYTDILRKMTFQKLGELNRPDLTAYMADDDNVLHHLYSGKHYYAAPFNSEQLLQEPYLIDVLKHSTGSLFTMSLLVDEKQPVDKSRAIYVIDDDIGNQFWICSFIIEEKEDFERGHKKIRRGGGEPVATRKRHQNQKG